MLHLTANLQGTHWKCVLRYFLFNQKHHSDARLNHKNLIAVLPLIVPNVRIEYIRYMSIEDFIMNSKLVVASVREFKKSILFIKALKFQL